MRLTNAVIRNAKPTAKAGKLYDSGGLYLEVSHSGGKWWRLKFRFNGKENRISLGVYPESTLHAARDRRDKERKLLAGGIDPHKNRKTEKSVQASQAANSFEQVDLEWFARFSAKLLPSGASRATRRAIFVVPSRRSRVHTLPQSRNRTA